MTLRVLLKQHGDSPHGNSEVEKHGQTKVVGTIENSGLCILCWRFPIRYSRREREKGGREGGRKKGGLAAWKDCAMKTQRKNKA